MLSQTFKFTLPEDPARWTLKIRALLKDQAEQLTLTRNGEVIWEETQPHQTDFLTQSRHIAIDPLDLSLEIGAISLMGYGVIVRRDDDILWRSHDKPFRSAGKIDLSLEKLEQKTAEWDAQANQEPTAEQRAFAERQKALRPSIFVDIGFGILFFFVAREFGLVTAALTGAGATFALFLINPFVKWDLLGGFAAFGAGMALISAGLAWGFQDDLAIKLRGTFMAMLGASFALIDAFVLNGGYLGKRMAMYMEGLGKLNPRRASLALAGATLLIMAIDTPLAFILTTDQWIWYNAFLDSLIAIPIIIGAMLFAREKKGLK